MAAPAIGRRVLGLGILDRAGDGVDEPVLAAAAAFDELNSVHLSRFALSLARSLEREPTAVHGGAGRHGGERTGGNVGSAPLSPFVRPVQLIHAAQATRKHPHDRPGKTRSLRDEREEPRLIDLH
jgi:hypothetical protein